jgi:hypothetical protein
MRQFVWCLVVVVVLILICGCIQPASAPVPPVTSSVEVLTPVTTTPGVPVQKQVNITVTQTKSEVIIQYNGGPDASDLVALRIRIDNQDGTDVLRTITAPVIGQDYIFTYRGNANARTVNIVGVFTGGVEQTVLMYYV